MPDEPQAVGFLADPLQPSAFRVCMQCDAWFALKRIAKQDGEANGSITTYRCKKCGAAFDFAEHHPTDAI